MARPKRKKHTAENTPNGWVADLLDDGTLQVWPLNDLRPHVVDGKGECWCRPRPDGNIMVHNSMDRREEYERGERVPT